LTFKLHTPLLNSRKTASQLAWRCCGKFLTPPGIWTREEMPGGVMPQTAYDQDEVAPLALDGKIDQSPKAVGIASLPYASRFTVGA
jgi:hypothetical protein